MQTVQEEPSPIGITGQVTQTRKEDCVRRTLDRHAGAKMVGLGLSTFDAERRKGNIRYCRVGRRILFLPEHIEEFLRRAESKPKAA